MRATLALLALLWLTLATSAAGAIDGGGARAARSSQAGARASARSRTLPVALAAAPDDLALAQVSFPSARPGATVDSLRAGVAGAFGADLLALGAPRFSSPGGPRALVLLVNRPSSLLDPTVVHVSLSAPAALGRPLLRLRSDPLTRPSPGARPALCDLRLHGAPLGAAQLRGLGTRGAPLGEFTAEQALAQAYDTVCGLAHSSAFTRAVSTGGACRPLGSICCPPTAICASPPGSPAPAPPGCAPCDPAPGRACPLQAPNVCAAAGSTDQRSAPAGAH